MNNKEAERKLKALLECLMRDISGTYIDCNCRRCDECKICYEQGNMGEQIEALDIAIKALEEQEHYNESIANAIDSGYTLGYTDAMIDIQEGEC